MRVNVAKLKRDMRSRMTAKEIEISDYRGFRIEGRAGCWFSSCTPKVYRSRKAAEVSVDACIAVREMVANATS